MIRRSTWILLLVFVVLVAGVVLWQRHKMQTASQTTEGTPTVVVEPSLLDFQDKVVTEMGMVGPEGTTLQVEQGATSGSWMVDGYPPDAADSTHIQNVVDALKTLTVYRSLENPPSLAQLGLANPAYRVLLTLNDGTHIVIHIGDKIPTGNGYYVQVDDQAPVVVAISNMNTIMDLVTTPPLLPTPTVPSPTSTPEPSSTPGG